MLGFKVLDDTLLTLFEMQLIYCFQLLNLSHYPINMIHHSIL